MKKSILFLACIGLIISSCKKSNEQLLQEIETLSASDKMGTPEGLKELAKLQENYGRLNSDSIGNSNLYAAALHAYHSNDTSKALELQELYISRDDSSTLYRNIAMGNAKMESGKGNSGVAASTIYAVMDKQILDGPQWRDAAIIIDKKINESADVQDYIGLSKIYTAMGNTQEAINQLDTAIRKYPDFDKRGNLILRAGFLGWEHLKDHEVAEKYYTQLINEYPNHPQVQEIKTILSSGYLQMSDEEILEQLRNKDK